MGEFDWHLYRAYQHLARSRQSGFGIQPITIESIVAYWRETAWRDACQAEEFVEAIQDIDQAWIEIAIDKQEKPSDSEPKG